VLEELKTQICHNVQLYATMYDEEFQEQGLLPKFVQATWGFLVALDSKGW
jgi:hypothetical protein